MIEMLNTVVNFLNSIIGSILVFVLLSLGFYFTIKSRFVQVRLFKQSIIRIIKGKQDSNESISPFQAFSTVLASQVGTGTVAGVAVAITYGGPGSVFWMWMTALIGMSSSFVENTIAQFYKIRNEDGSFRGGPAYYIVQGLGSKPLAIAFALSLILTFGFVFNSVQANTIAAATKKAWEFDANMVGLFLIVITAPIIFGGIKKVALVAEKMVPTMALLYIVVTIFIIITNISKFPHVISLIISDAFNFKSATGGFFGILTAGMIHGINRGLFANEAGLGSAPNIGAATDVKHPCNQGLIQMLGVFVATMIICSCTAFIVILSGAYEVHTNITGAELTQISLESSMGSYGSAFLAILLFMFCFSSIIGNYAFAESNVQFIKNNKIVLNVFRVLVLGMVYFGSIQEVTLVWNMADVSMGIMALINLFSIAILAPIAFKLLNDYEKQIKEGKNPQFFIKDHPELSKKLPDNDIWV